MPDPVNQLWLRFPDGSICTPRDPSLCLHAHLLNNSVAVIQHTDLHTWSLTASGLLRLDGTSECFDVNPGTKASIINCEFTNSSFVFGSTLNFAPLVDLASIISIYNDSTVNHDSKLVYLYGKFELSRITQNQVVLVRAPEELLDDYHFTIATFATAQVQVECQFHHPTYPVVTNQARYMWRMFTSSGVVCDLPKLQDSPETYTPRLVIDDEMYYAAAPLQVIKPRKVQHKPCQCLVM